MGRRLVLVLSALAAAEAAGTAVLGGCVAGLAGELAHPGAGPVDPAVGLAAGVLGWLVLTWLVGVTALAALAQWSAATDRGRTGAGSGASPLLGLAERCSPDVARRVAAVLLGAGLAAAAGASGPALAHGPRPAALAAAVPGASGGPVRADLAGWTPDRPAAPGAGAGHLVVGPPPTGLPDVTEVVVRRGDTLWGIVARHLGPGSDAAEIAAEWPRWHAANRGEIGPDPDLLRPGQRLRPPSSARTSTDPVDRPG